MTNLLYFLRLSEAIYRSQTASQLAAQNKKVPLLFWGDVKVKTF